MKKTVLTLICIIGAVRFASASNYFLYTATAAPGTSPSDGIDVFNGNAPVEVWSVGITNSSAGGIGGDYFGTAFSGETLSGWQIWTSPNGAGTGNGGSVDTTNIFPGGALTVGQTVSINFEMRATDLGKEVGVSLLNDSGDAIKFAIFGGEPNATYPYTGSGYYYSDAGSSYVSAGNMTYQYQNEFNIAFTVTGTNTYSAVAGSDSWSGTYSGSLIGIHVFNHGAGDGSDVGFNNLTVAPELVISNIFPDGTKTLFNATNTFSFNVSSPSSPVNASGLQLILNGVNVSSSLVISGAGTANVTASYTNLLLNTIYVGQISVTNTGGYTASAPVRFDTFGSNYFTWEAEDFDFNGGQFIDDPVISTSSPNSYYNQVGVSNVDEYAPNYSATQPHGWRPNDQVSTDLAFDTPRAQFTAAGIADYQVGYFNSLNWVNYTRTFPAGTYNVYGRLANGNSGLASCSLAEVTSGQGTTNQTTKQLGIFQFSARGWNSYDFVPLTDPSGNVVAITLNGQATLRVTSGPLGGSVNMNFFMLAPGTNTPPAIANIYPDGSQPFQDTNVLTFTVSSVVSTVSTSNIQVTLNGVNVSSQLAFNGSPTNWTVSLPLPGQSIYTCSITATDAAGHSHSYSNTFDTFSQKNLMIEAGDFDFNGGQWIDNALETAGNPTFQGIALTNSYYYYPGANSGNGAVYGVDFTTTNVTPDETYLYRLDGSDPLGNPAAGTETNTDFLRDKLINVGPSAQPPFEYVPNEPVPTTNTDFDVGWWPPGTWLNYTRTFPTNAYAVYGRLASGAAYTNATMSLVTAGRGTPNQTTQLLGAFSDPNANGFQSWHWIPLMNGGTNVVVTLGGVETLKVTAPPGSATGSMNAHFYMFVPYIAPFTIGATVSAGTVTIKFPTQSQHSYTVYYSTSLNPGDWVPLVSNIAGDGTVKTVTDSTTGGTQRFYKVQVQ